ncbi:MAG: cold shock domain-containing protein [Candidatus Melainabacteria bacterium]|nr:cold shock domain-containing protein [Candidatus Melainabacteria bacterium]
MDIERGIVKWFDEGKGFGFITPDVNGHKDIFFHRTDLEALEGTIENGTRVEYSVGQGAKGPQAKNVRPLSLE